MTWVRAGLIALVGALATVAVLVWLMGAPLHWSVLLAVPVAAVLLLLARSPSFSEPRWQPLPLTASAPSMPQASNLSNRLADAARDTRRFRSRIQPRLHALALAKIRQQPGCGDVVGLSDPRATQLLGEPLVRLLTDRAATVPTPTKLTEMLARLEEM